MSYLDDLQGHGLKTVLRKKLEREGIDTREKIAGLSIDDLLDMRNIGTRCIESLISSVYSADGVNLHLDLTYQQGGEYLEGLVRHGLNLRLCNRLIREGVTTREQLMDLSPDDLLEWWGIGPGLVKSLVIAMAIKGDRMAPSTSSPHGWDQVAERTAQERLMFYYYGSKRRLAPFYPPPVHRLIVEPFAGAAAYGVFCLANDLADRLILVDSDPRVVDIWERLLSMTESDLRLLAPPVAGERTSDMLHVVVAASNSWTRVKRGMTVTPRMVARWPTMINNISRELPHLREKIEVFAGDYRDSPDLAATWFIDPPYQPTRESWWSQGNGYSGSSAFDYSALAEFVGSRQGQVIVAEQDGADWISPLTPVRSSADSQGKPRKEVMFHEIKDRKPE